MSSQASQQAGPLTRTLAAVTVTGCVVAVASFYGLTQSRAALPTAAQKLLAATIDAGEVTTCLAGVQDDLYMPGQGRVHTAVSTRLALASLHGCDVRPLQHDLSAIHLPPQPPVLDARHRQASDDVTSALTLLNRLVLDVRGASRAMATDITGRNNGTAVILAYRSAQTGSDAAYALAVEALALLGESPSTPG